MGLYLQLRGGRIVIHDYEKQWFGQSLNQVGIARASEATHRLGKALPCVVTAVSGSFVTVAFEVNSAPWTLPAITIPKAEGPWIRSPTQVGDYGLTMPADAYVTAISGQGGGTPDLTQPGNLAALVWVPVASRAFSTVDTTKAFVSGPTGVVMQTEDGHVALTLTEAGLALVINGVTVSTWGGSGLAVVGTVTATGDVVSQSGGTNISLTSHVHSGVTSGGSDTGPPV